MSTRCNKRLRSTDKTWDEEVYEDGVKEGDENRSEWKQLGKELILTRRKVAGVYECFTMATAGFSWSLTLIKMKVCVAALCVFWSFPLFVCKCRWVFYVPTFVWVDALCTILSVCVCLSMCVLACVITFFLLNKQRICWLCWLIMAARPFTTVCQAAEAFPVLCKPTNLAVFDVQQSKTVLSLCSYRLNMFKK